MIYIVGANGFLGLKIRKIIPKKIQINISSSSKKNSIKTDIFSDKYLMNEKWIKSITKKDKIILLSNIGDINFYEKNPSKVKKFEKNLFKNFLNKVNKNSKIIFFSSDMVYSGKKKIFSEKSKTFPKNNYGKSKLRIEKKIIKNFKNYLILRFCKIYSKNPRDKNFYNKTILSIKSKVKNELFMDQKVHFLDLRDFEMGFKKTMKKIDTLKGIYNFPGKIFKSRYNFFKDQINNKKLHKYLIPINLKMRYNFLPINLKMRTKLFKKINFKPKYN